MNYERTSIIGTARSRGGGGGGGGGENKGRHMIYKILGGVVLALVVLVLVALGVRTTGSYARTFNASQDKVWRVWNDADSIKQWWGPSGYTAPLIRNDIRVGGTYCGQ